jgi:monovalent cation/proton antiporter MnhG/PhaG subunit
MTWQGIAAAVLLVLGVGIELLCCLGILVMDNVYDRLHYIGPASVLGPIAITVAVLFEEAFSMTGIMAILSALVLVGTGPVLTHALARAARLREFGRWEVQPDEDVEEL